MATRLYVNANLGAAPVTPSSWSTGWNRTTGVASPEVRGLTIGKGAIDSTRSHTNTGSGTSGHFTAVMRFISDPLTAQTISGTVKGQVAGFETNATDNYTLAVAIKVVQSNGSDRGVLLAVSASDNTAATPPELPTTTAVNRQLQDSSENTSLSLSSVDAQLGDRIVVELGYRQASASTAQGSLSFRADTLVTDLGENNTDNAAHNSWLEFSDDITFAIAYFGSAATPTDGAAATGTADPTAVTPPTGMLAGDLVCMIGQQRAASATLAISNAGGQSWTSETAISTTNQTARLFWCVFDGTWDANPSVDFSAAVCNSVQMHVFRPGGTNWTWSVNQALSEQDHAAAATITVTGQTTTGTDPTVTLAGIFSADDNTWGITSSAGWSNTGPTDTTTTNVSQYRNTSGSDQSAAYSHKIQTSAGATGNVARDEATNGNDAATSFIITFAAAAPAAAQDLTPSLFTETDTFFSPTVAHAAQDLSPSLFTENDTFFTQTVTAGAVNLSPSLFTETDIFFTPTVVSIYALTPDLFVESDTFFTPTVAAGAVNLSPSLYTEADAFFTQTVTAGAVDLSPALYSEADAFFTHTVEAFDPSQSITPDLYVETDTFFSPTVAATNALIPSLFTETDSFFDPIVASTYALAPNLYTESDTFFTQTVTVGAVNLQASLFTETDAFFSPTVSPGAVDVAPTLYVEADAFFSPTVAATYAIAVDLYVEADAFHAPTVAASYDIVAARYDETDTFFTTTVAAGAVGLTAALFNESDTFFTPVVQIEGGDQFVAANLFVETDTFHQPTVAAGAVNLSPSRYDEADTFFTQTVTAGAVNLSPDRYDEADAFFTQVVAGGAVDLGVARYDEADTFFPQTVSASSGLLPSLFNESDTFFTHVIVGEGGDQNLAPGLFTETDTFYQHVMTGGALSSNIVNRVRVSGSMSGSVALRGSISGRVRLSGSMRS